MEDRLMQRLRERYLTEAQQQNRFRVQKSLFYIIKTHNVSKRLSRVR